MLPATGATQAGGHEMPRPAGEACCPRCAPLHSNTASTHTQGQMGFLGTHFRLEWLEMRQVLEEALGALGL